MAVLTQDKIDKDVKDLLNYLDKSQWNFVPNFLSISGLKIMTRDDLRKVEMKDDVGSNKTSGSTGEPVTVGKSYSDFIWYTATSIREFRWLKWNFTKDIAVIKAGNQEVDVEGWGISKSIEPIQGRRFSNDLKPIYELQKWLEEKNPHYIHCLPSVFKQIDTSRISNFIDWKGTGEVGGKAYSSEECGIIALTCPDNPSVYHVMENQIVEVDSDGALIITTTSNKYIKRYKHGDHIEMGKCNCGRRLQTIKKIHGRVRNMMILPNGDKKWPLVGSLEYESFGIKRFQMVQTKVDELELSIICEPLGQKETELIEVVRKWVEYPINVIIKYVDEFPNYKFEEFVCKIKNPT
jgi:phenylacetate-CoA ligase